MGAECEDNWLLPLYFPVKSGKCEICGESHVVEKCPVIEGFTDDVPDTPSLSYARLTLPEGMEVRELSDGMKTVVATKSFSKGLKFGPFIAKTSTLIDIRIEFPFKVFLSEEESVYLETYEEIFCNWMCLVLPASCLEEQNLICFQIKTSIYFCSLRDIKKGEELRVWYAPYYAERMGVRSFSRPPDLVHSSDEEFQEIFESLQSGVEMEDQYIPKAKKKRRQPKKLVLGENYYREVPPNDVLPGELLGAAHRSEWECAACGQVERNVAAFARHLMTHCRPPLRPSYRCPYCDRNFRKDGNYRQVHLDVCRNKKLKELTQGDKNKPNQSGMTFIVKTVESNAAATSEFGQGIKNDYKLPLGSSAWNNSVVCQKFNHINVNNNDQLVGQSSGIDVKKELLYPEGIQNCKINTSENDTTEKSTSEKHDSGWNGQKTPVDIDVTESVQIVSTNISCKNNEDKSDKALGLLQNGKENMDENLLVKSHLETPILDLSDDIDFHLTKSLDEIMDDHCNLEKSMSFSKNRSLDLFGSVETTLLASDVPNHTSPLENAPFYFATCNDVTDEERNRIVENLLSETDDKFFTSDYDMTDGCVSDNAETQTKGDQSSKEKNKRRQSKTGGDFKCDICNKGFNKSLYLFRHLRKHTGEFRCNTCFMVFARKENLQNHRLSCLNEANSQEAIRRVRMFCKYCRLQFHSLPSLQEHMDQHYCTGDTWKCTCKETSNSADLFLTHKCSSINPFKSCTKCDRKLRSQKDFVEHKSQPILYIANKGRRQVLCEICGVMHLTATGARLHRQSHGEKRHKCSVCGVAFSRLDRLREHLKKHDTVVFWECPVCSKKFTSQKYCLKHQKNAHFEPSFTCNYCDKTFRQKVNYKKHLKTHEHKCSFCHEQFPSKQLLNDHLKKKHINNVYMCNMCHDIFPVHWRLKTHISRKHSERYKCGYCQMEIRYRNALRRHLNAQHKDKMEEWNSPKAITDMQINMDVAVATCDDAEEIALNSDQRTDLFAAVQVSDILRTAADDVMDIEENIDTDLQETGMDQSSNANLVTTIATREVTESSPPQDITFDLNVLHGSESVTQLVNVGGEVITVPIALVGDQPSPSHNISDIEENIDTDTQETGMDQSSNANLVTTIASGAMTESSTPQEITFDLNVLRGSENQQSAVAISQGAVLNYPLVLPEGCVLTLDNNLIAKQPTEGTPTLINVNDFQAISGATTSAFVLATEEDNDLSSQLQNHVLYYIVDDSISEVVE